MDTTKRFRIVNTISGQDLGDYGGENAEEALDTMARDAGFRNHAAACQAFPVAEGELSVTECTSDEDRS